MELKLWSRPDSYMGEQYPEYYIGFSIQRNSGNLELSNYAHALKVLGGESDPEVICPSFSHWAVGWVQVIMVHKDNIEKVAILQDLIDEYNNYPVLDEMDYCDRCFESEKEDWLCYGWEQFKEKLKIDNYKDYTKEEKLKIYIDNRELIEVEYEEESGTCFNWQGG